MRLRLAPLLPARFHQDARWIRKQLHSFRIAATNEHSLARRSWSLDRTPSWSSCVRWCCSSVWSRPPPPPRTVKHQCNEVLPGFGIGVSSVFSCWQSIYLPSNVWICVQNDCWKMAEGEGVEIALCVHSFLFSLRNDPFNGTTQLFMDHYTVLKYTITHENRERARSHFTQTAS